mmetsp:Transcript_18888/g.38150  ORF Transcript_18888/g.38150 Transcript_18888/m.38150 type:complete len:83 (-) Transcript_18888:193-441(-)
MDEDRVRERREHKYGKKSQKREAVQKLERQAEGRKKDLVMLTVDRAVDSFTPLLLSLPFHSPSPARIITCSPHRHTPDRGQT